MKVHRAPRKPIHRRAHIWTPDRVERFVQLWNEGAILERFREALGLETSGAVKTVARNLKARGVKMATRSPEMWTRSSRAAYRRDPERDGGLVIPSEGSLVAPAIIMDAAGRPIATMDPVTRERRAIRPSRRPA